MRIPRLSRTVGFALALVILAAAPAAARDTPEEEIERRRVELAALERAIAHLHELVAGAERGELLLRDDRLGLLHPLPRAVVAERAAIARALPAALRPLARPSLPPGTTPEALVEGLAAETRAVVDRELVPQLGALERARAATAERIAWLEREIERRAEEARAAAERARRAAEERARLEAERQRVEAERARLEAEARRLAEEQARLEAALGAGRAPEPTVAAPSTVPATAPAAAESAVRRAFERVEIRHETRTLRLAPPDGPAQQISLGGTPEGFVLFNLWLDRDRRLASFVCSWALGGLDDPLLPGREVTVELVGRCAAEAGPPLPVPQALRLEAEGLELRAARRGDPVELWTGTREGTVRLESRGRFTLRVPPTARPGEELQLRLVQPGCCTLATVIWR